VVLSIVDGDEWLLIVRRRRRRSEDWSLHLLGGIADGDGN
jgi:hypothetical protein